MFKVLGLVLLLSLGFQFSALADNEPISRNPSEQRNEDQNIVVRKKKPSTLFIGLDLRSYKYEEPGFVSHEGLMYGAWLDYTGTSSIGAYGLKGHFLYGGLKYVGALCDTLGNCTPYETSNQKDIIFNGAFDYLIKTNTNFTYKIGVGYRYLYDTVSETGFYQRTGAWVYLPFGVVIDTVVNNELKLQFDFYYSLIIYGGIKSNLSEVSSQYGDIYLSQTGNALNFAASLIYKKDYKLGLYYEGWNLNESGIGTTGDLSVVEPKNHSVSYGVKLGYNFF